MTAYNDELLGMDVGFLGVPFVRMIRQSAGSVLNMDAGFLGVPFVQNNPPPIRSTDETRPGTGTGGVRLSDDSFVRIAVTNFHKRATNRNRTTTVILRTAANRTGLL
jgi:hypothetical protein